MTTYSVRCRNSACRHRRVSGTHPNEYKRVPKCDFCGKRFGWRIEGRGYNKRNLCNCGGPINIKTAMPFPHNKNHPMCDHHPDGYYHQAKMRGVEDTDIPMEYLPNLARAAVAACRLSA